MEDETAHLFLCKKLTEVKMCDVDVETFCAKTQKRAPGYAALT